jgi:hypothetical protein
LSPRPGGEAAKFGDRYEGHWTTRQLLYVLCGQVDSVTVEEIGEIGEGAEFTVRRGTKIEVHQVKRQHGVDDQWQLSDLHTSGVLEAARRHVEGGRQFWFVSTTPAVVLQSLAETARQSSDLQSFVNDWLPARSRELRRGFKYLSDTIYSSAETAWTTLRGLEVHWPDERDVEEMNGALAGLLLEGAEPALAAAGLGRLAWDHPGVTLDAPAIEGFLAKYRLRRRQILGSPAIRELVQDILVGWQDSVRRELLQPTIPRAESKAIIHRLKDEQARRLFVTGTAGSGKSAVLYEAVNQVVALDWPVLAVRLDRPEPFSSTLELGARCGLDVSPVSALAAAANGEPCLLVIDQLDAISLASGRMPATFAAISDLLRESLAFPEMRIMLACRKFDADHDERIKEVADAKGVIRIEVSPLSDEEITSALQSMGLAADQLAGPQRDLLRIPLHLVLLRTVADQPDALSFTSRRQLFDAYWERKRKDCEQRRPQSPPRFATVIGVLAEAMSVRQRLSVRRSVLDEGDLAGDADVLVSEGVVVRDGERLAFFHQAFFDYAFARWWVNGRQGLVEFLCSGEQELFRRSQVQQILIHLRDGERERYLCEVEEVLTDRAIRFHIKDTVLAFLNSLPDPTTAECEMMARLIAAEPPWVDRLWLTMRTPPWFDRLDAEGVIEAWLAEGNAHIQEIMLGGATGRPERLSELLAPYAGRSARYPGWLGWVTRFADMYQSRGLFDLVLAAIRRGDYEGRDQALWLATAGRGQRQPAWAVELLTAHLTERPDVWRLDSAGRIELLQSTEHSAIELASQTAARAPDAYCRLLLPYLLQVMQLTEHDPQTLPIIDRQFSYRQPRREPFHNLDDALLAGAVTAIQALIEQDPPAAQPVLEQLAADRHDSAQWLLYEGLRSAGERYAAWAASLLLEGSHRLMSGYPENPFWTTRQLLQAITPHLPPEILADLERVVMDFRPPGERRQSAGAATYTLLSAMAEGGLSSTARRRLGKLRRRFNSEQPAEPLGVHGGFVRSPIPPAAAQNMTDEQWIKAMAKYATDEPDLDLLRGGAHELSQVLRDAARADPERFARLALRMTDQTNPAYGDAVLQALADTKEPIDPSLVFDVIRHIASLGNEAYQDWLGWPLRRYLDSEVPDDITEIILDRALHAISPAEDRWAGGNAREPLYGGDIWANGLNSARGQSVVVLGDLLLHDTDGHRTALITPSLTQLAEDPTVAVRCCVSRLLAACLRHARPEAVAAFRRLIVTDDRLLATNQVLDLMVYIGSEQPAEIEPVIERMLSSPDAEVRQAGGMMAAFAGLEFQLGRLLPTALNSQDPAPRKGVAGICARRLPLTSAPMEASEALTQLLHDRDEEVRKAAAEVAVALRGQPLQPFVAVLTGFISSPAFEAGLTQLLFTLQQAPDRIDNLIILCADRFLDLHGANVGNIATAAAGEARHVGQLILGAYARATSQAARAKALDLIDRLLLAGAYDFARMVDEAER